VIASPTIQRERHGGQQHTMAGAMSDSDLCWMSAFDLARAIAKKKVSPLEVVDAVLARIDALKALNAYVTLDADGARAAREFFERYDLLLTPTVAFPPLPIGELYPATIGGVPVGRDAASAFTYIFNMTGQPAATVPCSFTKVGLPIGLQIVGRRFDDVTVLRASAAFESVRPWAQRRPELDRAG
jgi:Asp-tRNA(Asn)/Glu-tRNA(Gln) amidotransferase A subunit family amidase